MVVVVVVMVVMAVVVVVVVYSGISNLFIASYIVWWIDTRPASLCARGIIIMATFVFFRLPRQADSTALHQETNPALKRLVAVASMLALLLGPNVSRAQSLPSIEE